MTSLVAGERGAEPRGLGQARRPAYACAEAVAAQLGPGVTERGAARMRHGRLRRHNVPCRRPPRPGAWAVGPHRGFRSTGATFEELLMVTDARDPGESAFWLDDDPPHARRWTEGV
ncbi:hypothetical protein ACFT5C_01250 [Streptomyces sp. NPDC057116]|uniref:hypothetical protein n=1 Tax=Streptomyces sp. NPDC057116 TaxID=3346023 RepID=UPI003636353B